MTTATEKWWNGRESHSRPVDQYDALKTTLASHMKSMGSL